MRTEGLWCYSIYLMIVSLLLFCRLDSEYNNDINMRLRYIKVLQNSLIPEFQTERERQRKERRVRVSLTAGDGVLGRQALYSKGHYSPRLNSSRVIPLYADRH